MPTFSQKDFEVYGFFDGIGSADEQPRITFAVLKEKNGNIIIADQYEVTNGVITAPEHEVYDEDWIKDRIEEGKLDFTPVKSEHPPSDAWLIYYFQGKAEYITAEETVKRLNAFCDPMRTKGDASYRAGDMQGAEHAYHLCSAVSQTARDYARLLLVMHDLPKMITFVEERIRSQGHDPKALTEEVKAEILAVR